MFRDCVVLGSVDAKDNWNTEGTILLHANRTGLEAIFSKNFMQLDSVSHPCINPTWPKIPRSKLHGYVVSTSTPQWYKNPTKIIRQFVMILPHCRVIVNTVRLTGLAAGVKSYIPVLTVLISLETLGIGQPKSRFLKHTSWTIWQ